MEQVGLSHCDSHKAQNHLYQSVSLKSMSTREPSSLSYNRDYEYQPSHSGQSKSLAPDSVVVYVSNRVFDDRILIIVHEFMMW